MNNISRYEVINEKYGMVYDRKNGKILFKDEITNMNEIMSRKRFCIYPWKWLRNIEIPESVIIIFILGSYFLLIFSIFIFTIKGEVQLKKIIIFPSILITPILSILSIFLHEISHAVVAVSMRGIVTEIGTKRTGFLVKYYTKTFFDTNKKIKRVPYYLSGPAMNSLLAGIFILFFIRNINSITFFMFVINLIFTVINLLPMGDSDGFQIVKILLESNDKKYV